MSPRSYRKTSTWSAVNFKKHLTSMSCQLEPAIWSRDTGQRIPCFDMCQLITTWMSNTEDVQSKPRLHVSMSTCYLEHGRHVARLRHRRHTYAPTSNTASHDNHEKINSWVSFCFPYLRAANTENATLKMSSSQQYSNFMPILRCKIL